MLASLACVCRRLACRYWVGRVALRETARVNIVSRVRDEVRRALRCARRALRPRRMPRDSTLVAWYRSLYAPRTGGAYDGHHRTAEIAGRARRRDGGVAARGGRAATQVADRRFCQRPVAQRSARHVAAFRKGLNETGCVE